MNAGKSVGTPMLSPERRPRLALEAQVAELRHALDYTIEDVHIAAGCAICETELESWPDRGRGRPPKFTPVQAQLLALEEQIAKLRGELEATLSIIRVQKRDFTRCRGCPRINPTPGADGATTLRRRH